ncbi:MAG TPA: hypothetical protein PLF26_07270 [Blastocatellia bacterium]|nr:hypothetical protein [Blastocatellia bacterium]
MSEATEQIPLLQRSPACWRVTLNHPLSHHGTEGERASGVRHVGEVIVATALVSVGPEALDLR